MNDGGPPGLLAQVRCPFCRRLACEASEGALVRVKCARCGKLFKREVLKIREPQ